MVEDLESWLEHELEESQIEGYWPRGCGPRSRRRKTKRARRQHKPRAKEVNDWCKACARKRRAWKLEVKRMGARGVKDGWKMRAGDCYGTMCEWANASELRASDNDARDRKGHTRIALGVRG